MTSKATSNYVRILELGEAMARTLTLQRPSNMTDWPTLETVWAQLELRLRTMHGYDVLSGMQDQDVLALLQNLRRRLHYWDMALRVGGYADLLPLSNTDLMTAHALDAAKQDQTVLIGKGLHYGDSWKRRGGVGAFMMLARKWDRMENLLSTSGSGPTLLATLQHNPGQVQDDVHDLRRYLLLVEDEAVERHGQLDAKVQQQQVLAAKLTPIPAGRCTLFLAEDFKRGCMQGLYVDADGYGYLATSDGYDESFPVKPSTIVKLLATNYTHVAWFNL